MRKRQFNIDVTHTLGDDVWVATSDDIRGLVVEAEGFQVFLAELVDISVELLTHNHGASDEQLNRTRLCCHITHKVDKHSSKHSTHPEVHISELQLATG